MTRPISVSFQNFQEQRFSLGNLCYQISSSLMGQKVDRYVVDFKENTIKKYEAQPYGFFGKIVMLMASIFRGLANVFGLDRKEIHDLLQNANLEDKEKVTSIKEKLVVSKDPIRGNQYHEAGMLACCAGLFAGLSCCIFGDAAKAAR